MGWNIFFFIIAFGSEYCNGLEMDICKGLVLVSFICYLNSGYFLKPKLDYLLVTWFISSTEDLDRV